MARRLKLHPTWTVVVFGILLFESSYGAPSATRFHSAAGTPEQKATAFLATWRNICVNESPAVTFEQEPRVIIIII
jgi:hypothetical protein